MLLEEVKTCKAIYLRVLPLESLFAKINYLKTLQIEIRVTSFYNLTIIVGQNSIYKPCLQVNFLTPKKAPPNDIKNKIGKNSNVFLLPMFIAGLPITASVLISSNIKLD